MAKIELNPITSGYNLPRMNSNFQLIEDEFRKVVYRDEAGPMLQTFDMNGFGIINLASINGVDADVVTDLQSTLDQAAASAASAAQSADEAEQSATEAAVSAQEAIDAKLEWKGDWSAVTAYEINDAVYHNGSSYIATAPSTNVAPPNTSFWDLLAQRGLDGASGDGSGDVISTETSSVDGELVLFDGGSGKLIRASTQTGLAKLTAGVLSTAVPGTDYFSPADVVPITSGGTGETTAAEAFDALKQPATGTYSGTSILPFGYIYGFDWACILDSLTVYTGAAVDSTGNFMIRRPTTITKQLTNNWTEGNTGGAREAGLGFEFHRWYYINIIAKADGTTDVLLSKNPWAPVLPAGYTYFRRIGCLKSNASGYSITTMQAGYAAKAAPTLDYNAPTINMATQANLDLPPVKGIIAHLNIVMQHPSSGNSLNIFSGLMNAGVPSAATEPLISVLAPAAGQYGIATVNVPTNKVDIVDGSANWVSGTNFVNIQTAYSGGTLRMSSLGWYDARTIER